MKKVAVVSVADAEEAARLADLPLEATVALAEVAGAIKDGLLAFASATGFVVMHQMMQAELTQAIGEKHAKIGADRWCWAGAGLPPSARGAGPRVEERSSSTPGGRSARPTCSTHSSSSACWPGWPPDATSTWPTRSEANLKHGLDPRRSRLSHGAS